jgi:predicted metal-dependent hydrolase
MQKYIEDKELGRIIVRKYNSAHSYKISLKHGEVFISMPLLGQRHIALELLEKHREELLAKQKTYAEEYKPEADERQLRKQAKAYLPGRLQALAHQYGFTYAMHRISSGRSRWGSCSTKKNINLSLFLMALPKHLIDYVILHELCHTQIMNHSPEFWKLLDSVTQNKAKALRRELRETYK